MDIKRALKFFFCFGSAVYTLLSASVIITAICISGDSAASQAIVPERFLCLLFLSFVMALGSTVKRIGLASRTIGIGANALCYIGGFFAFLMMCGFTAASAVIATLIFSAVYVLVIVVALALQKKPERRKVSHVSENNKKSKKKHNDEEYKSMFS